MFYKKRNKCILISILIIVCGLGLNGCKEKKEEILFDKLETFEKIKESEEEKDKILLPYTEKTDRISRYIGNVPGRGMGRAEDENGEDIERAYGYINLEGEWVIPAEYDSAGYFNNGLACVEKEEQFGYIDGNGQMIIEPQYDWASDFNEDGTAIVLKGEECYQIDRQGEVISEKLYYDDVDYYYYWEQSKTTKYLIVERDGKWGVIDDNAKEIIAPKYNHWVIPVVENNLLLAGERDDVTKQVEWKYINLEGEVVKETDISAENVWVCGESYDVLVAIDKEAEFSVISGEGDEIISLEQSQMDESEYFSLLPGGKLVFGEKNGKYGGVDLNQQVIVPFEYECIGEYNNGAIMLENQEGKVGFVNAEGEQIVDFEYEDADCYGNLGFGFNKDGYACVSKNGKLMYVDKNGNEICPRSQFDENNNIFAVQGENEQNVEDIVVEGADIIEEVQEGTYLYKVGEKTSLLEIEKSNEETMCYFYFWDNDGSGNLLEGFSFNWQAGQEEYNTVGENWGKDTRILFQPEQNNEIKVRIEMANDNGSWDGSGYWINGTYHLE